MQSSSAEVTMMESQNHKRAPAWTEREVWDLIAIWGDESVLSELRSSFRNAKTFVQISQGMKNRGGNRDPKQCHVKLKELRQVYPKTREANGRSGSEPQTCHFYDELYAILGGSATTTPTVLFDSFNGDGGNMEAGFGDEEDDDDDEVVDSSQQASRETGFPDSQELFLTPDLELVPPEPTQDCLPDPPGGEGTSVHLGKWSSTKIKIAVTGTVDAIQRYWPLGAIPECSLVTALNNTVNSDALARVAAMFRFYRELHAIMRGDDTTTPPLSVDACKGGVAQSEEDELLEDEKEEEEEDSAQAASGESVFPPPETILNVSCSSRKLMLK
ncbi:hypothetical protein UY3_16785 [Chelonia mydas]|uniref:Myb/SANT-like DNA-binding domain-containing protein n=1 Tax=Chelonia mydas TaxID=8469 RepID=M7ALR4_CHEMY|nr:hypothetical protein UY3_16785 [Chelonia mydas]